MKYTHNNKKELRRWMRMMPMDDRQWKMDGGQQKQWMAKTPTTASKQTKQSTVHGRQRVRMMTRVVTMDGGG